MADKQVNALTSSTPTVDDLTISYDNADTSELKKTTWQAVRDLFKTYFDTIYQAVLVSGTNIKTVNGNSLLGSGDVTISGSGSVATDSIWDAKGDLAVGTGANTASRLGVGANGTVLIADSAEATGVKWGAVAGSGDVTGPASSTDNAIVRFDSTTGKVIQNSTVIVSDTGDISGVGELQLAELRANSSAGVDVHNNSGTQVAIFGAGGSTGTSIVGTTNIGSASADYHQLSGGTGTITNTATGSSSNIDINLVPKGTGRTKSGGINVPTISSTDTLTNKRITKRVETVSSSATPASNTDNYDITKITGLATNITSLTSGLTGTPVDGDLHMWSFTDNGTARSITPGSSFENSTVSFPTTTVISTRLDVLCEWNSATSKWRVIATA